MSASLESNWKGCFTRTTICLFPIDRQARSLIRMQRLHPARFPSNLDFTDRPGRNEVGPPLYTLADCATDNVYDGQYKTGGDESEREAHAP